MTSYRNPAAAATLALSLIVLAGAVTPLDARPARPAPPLPAPAGAIVRVATEAELQAAVRSLASNTTIVVAPGTYVLTRTLYVKGVSNVGIRGATGNPDDVVLVGRGMSEPNYGEVPFGIWTGQGVDDVTIANLTIRDLFFHPIIFNAGTQRPHVYNVHLVDAGEQFIKANPDDLGGGVNDGIVEYSVIEFTTTGRDDYSKGVDIQAARNWIIRHNLFRNLLPASGQLSGPGVLAWRGTRNTLVEGNAFVNCSRGVMFGADDYISPSQQGGAIRNNVFFRAAAQPGDVGIILSDSPDTQIVNNTVFLSGTYGAPIEYRYAGTRGVLIANNLLDGAIRSRDNGAATLTSNVEGAGPGLFADAPAGDLHLSAAAVEAIDRGTTVAGVVEDWDGQPRPQGAAFDIGADEQLQAPAPAPGPTPTPEPSPAPSPDPTPSPTPTPNPEPNPGPGPSPNPGGSAASAAFVRNDVSTRGNWIGTYGSQGYSILEAATVVPAYAQGRISSASTWTWAASTADARGLQRPGSGDRVSTCWFSDTAFDIEINFTDGQPHQVAIYSVDWDFFARSQRVDVIDATTNAVLDSRTISGFEGGQYLVWTLSGHVTLRVSNTGGLNAVVSGIFFDAPTVAPPGAPAASATFTNDDTTTQGNWTGAYGAQGYALAGYGVRQPSWAQVTVGNAATWIWAATTADPRGLLLPDGSDRGAACWYAPGAFTIDVAVTDGASHQVALYNVNWDQLPRSQRVEVIDSTTGAVLDSRTITGFEGGRYLVWTVRGRVTLRVINQGDPNAVVSAVFFD